MNIIQHAIIIAFVCLLSITWEADGAGTVKSDPLDAYNVVWATPSTNHNGSMPIGNGDIGMNVWVEQNGDLLLYLSKTDAWSENCRLLKLGKVRVSLSPNPFSEGTPFNQTLRLRQGEITIAAGEGEEAVALRIWVDSNKPVIRLEAESSSPFDMQAKLEIWRTDERKINAKGQEANSAYGLHKGPKPIIVYPDTVLTDQKERIVWYHRNEKSIWQDNLKLQGMESFIAQSHDPLLNRTFGGQIAGTGLVNINSTTLKSNKPQTRFVLSIHPLCQQTETVEDWLKELDQSVAKNGSSHLKRDYKKHREWWDAFWDRSWIRASGSPDAETVTRGYTLQRWISACAGRGKYPIKFNGTLFTVDGGGFDADYRRWGGPYWWQNTRLPYWPMLASGDFEMMLPMFQMYKEMMPLAEHRTKIWFGHGGSNIAETHYFWGMYVDNNYGWDREGKHVSDVASRYIRLEYTASLELMAMMLDYYAYTGDAHFLEETLLPLSDSLLEFWDKHYKNDENGQMRIYPAQALETIRDAENPTCDVAGLKWVLGNLLDIPENKVGAKRLKFWKQMLDKVPPIPMAEKDGNKRMVGAKIIHGGNMRKENSELYPVFPFRIYGVGKPDLEIGRRTFKHRTKKGNSGWYQDDTQAAFLGLTEKATEFITGRAKNKHDASRFPAFWGPNYDWVPDQDHGGNLLMGLQTMILQADDGKIRLLPAWPKNWDLDFKLHAPQGTTVEGRVNNGKLVDMKVTPESRRQDIVLSW